MRELVGMRSSDMLIRFAVLLALLASYGRNTQAQTRAEANEVKSLIGHANDERPLLTRILSASDAETLSGITSTNTPKSRIGQMLCSLRLFQLNGKEGGLAVLKSLPRSDIEMEALNEFTHQKQNRDFAPLYRAYYAAAFQSVVFNPSFLHSIFRFSTEFDTKNWPDYDDTDWYCSELANIRKAIPEEYDRAVLRESSKDREFLKKCGASTERTGFAVACTGGVGLVFLQLMSAQQAGCESQPRQAEAERKLAGEETPRRENATRTRRERISTRAAGGRSGRVWSA